MKRCVSISKRVADAFSANIHRRSNDMAAGVRQKVILACTECKQRNYNTMKNKRNNPERIELMKYCKFCNKETLHKETK